MALMVEVSKRVSVRTMLFPFQVTLFTIPEILTAVAVKTALLEDVEDIVNTVRKKRYQ